MISPATIGERGYYQRPVIHNSVLYFLCEGDLWRAQLGDRYGMEPITAVRLTAGLGSVRSFAISSDGQTIVFLSTQEGAPDLYTMKAEGGLLKRLTYQSDLLEVVGFKDKGVALVRASHESPFSCLAFIYEVNLNTAVMTKVECGPANFIDYHPKGAVVLGRYGYGYVSWKRYRGGTAGEIWIKKTKTGAFERLFENLKSNLLRPLFLEDRLYFQSDHEGMGALYSADMNGNDLKRHTNFDDFYVREITTDGRKIVYQKGGDIGVFDPKTQENTLVPLETRSVGPLRARYFASADECLTDFGLSPSGEALCLTTRGRLFVGPPFKGPMWQLGDKHGVRYRLGTFVEEARVLAVQDEGTQEALILFHTQTLEKKVLKGDWGRITGLWAAPCGGYAALVNHEHTLFWVSLKDGTITVIDKSTFGTFQGISISPDSGFVAYSLATSQKIHTLYMWEVKTGKKYALTEPVLGDYAPFFDPKGRHLYFLSKRRYTEGEEKLQPFLLTLSKETPSPFLTPNVDQDKSEDAEENTQEEKTKKSKTGEKGKAEDKVPALTIDLEGILGRSVPFPVPPAMMRGLWASGDRVFFLLEPSREGREASALNKKPAGGEVTTFDLMSYHSDHWASDVVAVRGSSKGEWLATVSAARRVRVVRSMEKPQDEDPTFRKGGWFDAERVVLEVDPPKEWAFMFSEAWRLQRDLFWDSKMKTLDWEAVRVRYSALLPRLHTPADLMDVIAEMQGELGSSHAYVWGFDQNDGPDYRLGLLGASVVPLEDRGGVRVASIVAPDVTDPLLRSPLLEPGVNVGVGDVIVSVDGQKIDRGTPLESLLVAKADQYVALGVEREAADSKVKSKGGRAKKDKADKEKPSLRQVWIKPARNLELLRYTNYVRANQAYVHEKTKGRVGYIHIPDMSHWGYQAFFKAYAHEFEREALILDVRFNRGGMISTQVLSQLMRKRLGYDQSRHEGKIAYMLDAPQGPMVALCNEYTASDGDMFSHAFKKLNLGPLIGKRTWGGVIGIFPKYDLLDGSWTSQPEYAIWFHDVGWRIENQGAEPDIVVGLTPDEAAKGLDPQLERGIHEALLEIERKKEHVAA